MRYIFSAVLLLAATALVAFVFQVLIHQQREEGSFFTRVGGTLDRHLHADVFKRSLSKFDGPSAPAKVSAPSPPVRESAPQRVCPQTAAKTGLTPDNPLVIKPSDVPEYTACVAREMIRNDTQAELDNAVTALRTDAAQRDNAGFWSDVELSAVFFLLSLMLPIAFQGFSRLRH